MTVALPAFSVTGTLKDIPGTNDGSELVTMPVPPSTALVFTHNVRKGYPVVFGGQMYYLPLKIIVAVNPDGTISGVGDPVLLLANDPGLTVAGGAAWIRWTLTVQRPGGPQVAWTFDALGDGGVMDLSSVMLAPSSSAPSGVDGGTPWSAGSGSIDGGGV